MEDIVLQGYVSSFAEDRGFTGQNAATLFEAFSVSAILRKLHHTDSSDFEDFMTGGPTDGGLDAVAILINGRPVRSKEDVDHFIEKLRRFDVEFVFIQAKTASSFDSAGIGTFVHGANQFFSQSPTITFRQEIRDILKIKDYVYERSINMENNPRCYLYYVTTGRWDGKPEPRARFEEGRESLESRNIFSKVNAVPIDAERLKTIYKELERGLLRNIEFGKIAIFPRIEGVREAYLGLLPGDEFVKLVTTSEGDLNRDLFYDNVRDFQGNNPVNREIEHTINNTDAIGRFPLLNNGVTIVARSIRRTGDTFTLSDFQIVNGCQTTHVLYQCRDVVDERTFIPVKLVVADDSDVITEVIKATNRQTAVLPEALESLTPFHKELEEYYFAKHIGLEKDARIYYERRSKQFAFERIKSTNIVTLTAQTKAFVAMFLNEPHSHHRYYGELLKSYDTRVFVKDHRSAPYYASGWAICAVERAFNSGMLARDMKKWRYHILLVLRIKIGGATVPNFSSRKIETYCDQIVRQLDSEANIRKNCEVAIKLIERALKDFVGGQGVHPSRLRAFTSLLMNRAVGKAQKEVRSVGGPKEGDVEEGKILWFDDWKNYGFIQRDQGGPIFVHAGGMTAVPWHLRKEGTRVAYKVARGRRGLLAGEVRVKI